MFNITHYQRNTNENHNEVSSHFGQNDTIKKSADKHWRECGEEGNLLHCWWECKLIQSLQRTVQRFLRKQGIKLPQYPAIPFLGIHTEETRSERDTYTPMFIAVLFTIAWTWKQPGCPLADEWIRKLWYIYTGSITQL